jgi:AcrR family transcriptional regulator
MPTKQLSPRKRPKQDRSMFMVETILQAATRVLSAESLAGFNTNRVAEVAGISVGSVYQYFPNKSALVVELLEREHIKLCAQIEQCIEKCRGKSLRYSIARLAKIAVDHQHGDAIFAAALDHEERRLPSQISLANFQQRIILALNELMRRHQARLPVDLPSQAASDCLVIAKALVESEQVNSPAQKLRLRRRVTRALFGYLNTEMASCKA